MKSLPPPTLEAIESLVAENRRSLMQITGDCKRCPRKRDCHRLIKNINIDYIARMDYRDSRFPTTKRIIDLFPPMLHLVPFFVFDRYLKSMNYFEYSVCPYQGNEIVANLEKIRQCYSLFSDQKSKEIYADILLHRLTLAREHLWRAYSEETQYFIQPFSGLGKSEVIVDCGAYNGDTMESYLRHSSAPARYYLYEPDRKYIEEIKGKIKRANAESYAIVRPYGAYKESTTLYCTESSARGGSFISETNTPGSSPIEVKSIDQDVDDAVSFIKMDIEGSEKSALLGCKQTIQKYRPRLAICIYHKITDLWELMLWIHELAPDYQFAVRHHEKTIYTESVLYAWVPQAASSPAQSEQA